MNSNNDNNDRIKVITIIIELRIPAGRLKVEDVGDHIRLWFCLSVV